MLKRAAELVGTSVLSARLGVRPHVVDGWLAGGAIPESILEPIAEVILEDSVARARDDRRAEPRARAA
jgi:hypothetical protein